MQKTKVPNRTTVLYLLMGVSAAILAAAVVIVYNNSFRSTPLYLFLLFAGIGLTLSLGTLRGGLVGLIIICFWVILKRTFGTWTESLLFNNFLELASVLLVFVVCSFYNKRLFQIMDAYYDNIQKLEYLDLLDDRVGLIKPVIGKLRLIEEEERSVRYRRPFSLVLVQVQPSSEWDLDMVESVLMMRIVANTLKSTTRKTDVPFLAASDQIGLILPETSLKGANKAMSNIMQRMASAHYMSDQGGKVSIQNRIQIRYGCAAFMGRSEGRINMIEAAQRSLEMSMKLDPDQGFQNSTIQWELVGEELSEDAAATPPAPSTSAPPASPAPSRSETASPDSGFSNKDKNWVIDFLAERRGTR